jgi:Spy/CpxP family protein refolding chaperone
MSFIETRTWMTGMAAALVAALAIPALAGQPQQSGRRAHDRFKQVLTQEQMEQVRPWLKAEREATQPLMTLRRQLREALLAEAPDQGKIAALQSQIAPLQAEALSRRVALAQRVAALLTPEQREQFRASRMLPPFLDPAGGGHPPFGAGGPDGHRPDRPAAPAENQ